ncbi:MAG: GNAT family N-acetyltransferase [Lachnospiraceae bacterium]
MEYRIATKEDIEMMSMFSHPTGNRAHLMNVYTNADYRRQGVVRKLVQMLIDEAKGKGVTEISLDATDLGRPLYETLGFCASNECMVMNLVGKNENKKERAKESGKVEK